MSARIIQAMENLSSAYRAVETTRARRDSLVQQRAAVAAQIDVAEEELGRMRDAVNQARSALTDLLSKEK